MNAEQKRRLKDALEELAKLQQEVQDVADELQGEYDDKSEKWQEGEAGQAMADQIEAIAGAADSIGDVCGTIQDNME